MDPFDDLAGTQVVDAVAPLCDECISAICGGKRCAPVKGQSIRRRVRLKECDRRVGAGAVATAVSAPAIGPAVPTALLNEIQLIRHGVTEIIAPVVGRIEPSGGGTNRETIRIPQSVGIHLSITPVSSEAHDRGAAWVAFHAGVAGRAHADVHPPSREHDTVVLVLPGWYPLNDDALREGSIRFGGGES